MTKKGKFLFLCLVLLLLYRSSLSYDNEVFTLERVIDGDTLAGFLQEEPVRLRLAGIDAPEMQEEEGKKAKEALIEQLAGETEFLIEIRGRDRYGRILALCWVGLQKGSLQESINARLVESGWALAWDEWFLSLEQGARKEKRGMFSASP